MKQPIQFRSDFVSFLLSTVMGIMFHAIRNFLCMFPLPFLSSSLFFKEKHVGSLLLDLILHLIKI